MILKYSLAWLGMMVLAIINGTIRDFVYKPYVGELAGHQISTLVLISLFAAYFWVLARMWPIKSRKQAWTIGAIWFVLTIGFEFGLGLARGDSWGQLLHAYDLFAGQVWLFIPLWVLVAPRVFYRFIQPGSTSP